ncbi:polysaccharide deacetylase family protein [Labrys sp. La1]|uniref:polysaccharide deacetylase family protein n=1 Tax=Labrys sp. La1 TaxID=3404917 RepID=UPI003EBA9982
MSLARILCLAAALACALPASSLAGCPPEALGVSRTLPVGTVGGGAVGLKTYPQTLLLAPGEVVLTFDDGPMPGRTEKILDTLSGQCVKATFFMIGRNAAAAPALAARVAKEGHTVGYHSMTHPILRRLPFERARADIENGYRAVDRAVWGAAGERPHQPFFRFPGFADSPALNQWLASLDIVAFGADLWASDWEPETPQEELKLVLGRLEKNKGGIVLLHDIQPRTVAMLPQFLQELKRRGFRIVHIVPGPGELETKPAPAGWFSQTERILANQGKPVGKARRAAPQ